MGGGRRGRAAALSGEVFAVVVLLRTASAALGHALGVERVGGLCPLPRVALGGAADGAEGGEGSGGRRRREGRGGALAAGAGGGGERAGGGETEGYREVEGRGAERSGVGDVDAEGGGWTRPWLADDFSSLSRWRM